jgi:uroporphyrinogen decarboxylase
MTTTQTTSLSSRERVQRMFARQEQDRVPRHESFWQETITRWQSEGLQGRTDAVLDMLGNDFRGLCWSWPAPFPGQSEVISEDEKTQVIRDAFGATGRFWKGRSGTPEHIGFECDSPDTWYRKFRQALIHAPVQVDLPEAVRLYDLARERGQWTHLTGVESFEATRKLMGDEISLEAFALEPEWISDVSRVHTDTVLRNFEAIMTTGIQPDGVWIYGDMAYKNATMCSPQMYKELIWPDHKRLADWAHERGMPIIFHTDGDVNGVLDLYIEAGFDCLQPLEAKANMDVRRIAPTFGEKLAFFGNINVMLMAANDRDALEHEIKTKFEAGKATRGYAYHSDHSVPPNTSWETYRFVMECVRKYGNY